MVLNGVAKGLPEYGMVHGVVELAQVQLQVVGVGWRLPHELLAAQGSSKGAFAFTAAVTVVDKGAVENVIQVQVQGVVQYVVDAFWL